MLHAADAARRRSRLPDAGSGAGGAWPGTDGRRHVRSPRRHRSVRLHVSCRCSSTAGSAPRSARGRRGAAGTCARTGPVRPDRPPMLAARAARCAGRRVDRTCAPRRRHAARRSTSHACGSTSVSRQPRSRRVEPDDLHLPLPPRARSRPRSSRRRRAPDATGSDDRRSPPGCCSQLLGALPSPGLGPDRGRASPRAVARDRSRSGSSQRPGARAPSRPSTTSHPAARAAATSAVSSGPVGEVDDRLARRAARRAPRHARASHSRSGRSRSASGGQSPEREIARRVRRERGRERARRAARADHAGTFAVMPARISLSVLWPTTRPSRKTSVFTASPSASSQRGDDCLLVRDRHVRAHEPERREALPRRPATSSTSNAA